MKTTKLGRLLSLSTVLIMVALISGCATTQHTDGSVDVDPYEELNRSIYAFNDALDRHLMRPVAEAYRTVIPELVRDAITNFFNNLKYLNVILNNFLQGKFAEGISDITRFIVNSTIGIGGLFDVASSMGLPQHKEDFGQTLAAWGAAQGVYLNIPFSGPNTSRNVPNYASSYATNPFTYVSGIMLLPVTVLNIISKRANLLDASEFVEEASIDPYSFVREAYLQQRQFLIHDGNPPSENYDDLFDVEAGDESVLVIE